MKILLLVYFVIILIKYLFGISRIILTVVFSSRGVKTGDENIDESSSFNEVEHSLVEKSPLHVLLYGRSNHRLDSYSVLNAQNQVRHILNDLKIKDLYVTSQLFEEI